MALVDEVMAGEPNADWTVYVTGHSLGGALATLCAIDLAKRKCATFCEPSRLPASTLPLQTPVL
jgi:putative lipase involved disintegration of autophagic bodies